MRHLVGPTPTYSFLVSFPGRWGREGHLDSFWSVKGRVGGHLPVVARGVLVGFFEGQFESGLTSESLVCDSCPHKGLLATRDSRSVVVSSTLQGPSFFSCKNSILKWRRFYMKILLPFYFYA